MKYENEVTRGYPTFFSTAWQSDIFITYFPNVLITLSLDIIFSSLRSLPQHPRATWQSREKRAFNIFSKEMKRERK